MASDEELLHTKWYVYGDEMPDYAGIAGICTQEPVVVAEDVWLSPRGDMILNMVILRRAIIEHIVKLHNEWLEAQGVREVPGGDTDRSKKVHLFKSVHRLGDGTAQAYYADTMCGRVVPYANTCSVQGDVTCERPGCNPQEVPGGDTK